MAIGGDLGGPKAWQFLWIVKRNVSRLESEIGQAQSKMGQEGSSRGSKFKKAKYYQLKEKKIVA